MILIQSLTERRYFEVKVRRRIRVKLATIDSVSLLVEIEVDRDYVIIIEVIYNRTRRIQ